MHIDVGMKIMVRSTHPRDKYIWYGPATVLSVSARGGGKTVSVVLSEDVLPTWDGVKADNPHYTLWYDTAGPHIEAKLAGASNAKELKEFINSY